jgi:hypothetical protein
MGRDFSTPRSLAALDLSCCLFSPHSFTPSGFREGPLTTGYFPFSLFSITYNNQIWKPFVFRFLQQWVGVGEGALPIFEFRVSSFSQRRFRVFPTRHSSLVYPERSRGATRLPRAALARGHFFCPFLFNHLRIALFRNSFVFTLIHHCRRGGGGGWVGGGHYQQRWRGAFVVVVKSLRACTAARFTSSTSCAFGGKP